MIRSANLTALCQKTAEQLAARLPGTEVHSGFCRAQFFGTLAQPRVSVMLHRVESQSGALGGFYGAEQTVSGWQECAGTPVQATLRIRLFWPARDEQTDPQAVFETLYRMLEETEETELVRITAGETEYLEAVQCFCTVLDAECRFLLVSEEETALLSGIRLVKK